jgi:fluoride exporter
LPSESIRRAVVVFLGGGIGASLRALLLAGSASWGTVVPVLIANLLGAFLLGAIFALADDTGLLGARIRLFLAVGILGGFTTFSTFGWGADLLFADDRGWAGSLYVGGSVVGGLAGVTAGLYTGRYAVRLLEHGATHVLRRLDERGLRRDRDPRLDMDAIETEDRGPQS